MTFFKKVTDTLSSVTVASAIDADILDGQADDTPIGDPTQQRTSSYAYLPVSGELDYQIVDGKKTGYEYNYRASDGDLIRRVQGTHDAFSLADNSAVLNLVRDANAKTLAEATTRCDALGRVSMRTQWLTPLGVIDPNNVPIAGENGVAQADGLTTRTLYDDNLADGLGLDSAAGIAVSKPGGRDNRPTPRGTSPRRSTTKRARRSSRKTPSRKRR